MVLVVERKIDHVLYIVGTPKFEKLTMALVEIHWLLLIFDINKLLWLLLEAFGCFRNLSPICKTN